MKTKRHLTGVGPQQSEDLLLIINQLILLKD